MEIDPKAEEFNTSSEEKISQEEYEKHKKELMEFYEKEIPYLEKKSKYETLLTEIAVAETTRVEAIARAASIRHQVNEAAKKFQEEAAQHKSEPVKPQK